MQCKNVEELLLTEYLDGEASPEVLKNINNHLDSCASCSAFKEKVLNDTKKPFENAATFVPPVVVWQNIESALDKGSKWSLRNWLTPAFVSAFAVAAVALILFTGVDNKKVLLEEEALEYKLLSEYTIPDSTTANLTMGTIAEENFLQSEV